MAQAISLQAYQMRTKLFLAFLLVIFIALISNLIFERLIMRDFDAYIKGVEDDHLHWVRASVEGSHQNGKWNLNALSESAHWAMMLGFDLRVEDQAGRELMSSQVVMASLPEAMKKSMESVVHLHHSRGEFTRQPLQSGNMEIGALFVRQIERVDIIKAREDMFTRRVRDFLIISFLIAGTGAVVMALFLSRYLSRPLRQLKSAAEKVAKGDFGVRLELPARDEIGKLAESFNYMAEALQKEDLLRKRLTSNIAHELRTPLAVMRAQAEALADGVITDKSAGLENISGEIERLTRLVEGIEDISKAEASFFSEAEYREINLKEFLKGLEHALKPVFNKKGLTFSVMDRGEICVSTDADKLDRIMKNVVANALKFTENGGTEIDYGIENKGFFVEVRDSGVAIPEDEIQNIFKRFYRGTNAHVEGIGIGLAIVKELVDLMGGKIEVKSRVGEGTRFKVWLPVKKQD